MPELLPPGTPIFLLQGKEKLPGVVYAAGRTIYHLVLDNGSETYTTVLDSVVDARPKPQTPGEGKAGSDE